MASKLNKSKGGYGKNPKPKGKKGVMRKTPKKKTYKGKKY